VRDIAEEIDGYDLDDVLECLRSAGEQSRLRILATLHEGELTVSEITHVLAQSQPRISRHLKLMADAGLIERRREGSWAFFRLARDGFAGSLSEFVLSRLSDSNQLLMRDKERREQIRRRRADAAELYFRENAGEWDRLRALHAEEEAVEQAALEMLRPSDDQRFDRLFDLGAGTGRMLEVFEGTYASAVGYDVNQQMLSFARSRLDRAALGNVELRQEDILALPETDESADALILHQVLHFLSEPELALAEARRVLRPGGKLLVVDFAPHEQEFLREHHAHRRLGFARSEIEDIAESLGLGRRGYQEIPAPAALGSQGLTVSLWLLDRPAKV